MLVKTLTVALVGNPNTGKTTLFNALAGMRQRVGNYPGVTVETKKGSFSCDGRVVELIDLPGTYSLAPRSPDEMVAVDLVLGKQAGEARPDLILSIVDASNLERNLYLTTQAMELGVPVVVALNMVDVAEGQGVKIDAPRLAHQLGMPVVPIQANKGKGLDLLRQAIAGCLEEVARNGEGHAQQPVGPVFPAPFEQEVQELGAELGDGTPPFLVRRLLLDVGGYAERQVTNQQGPDLGNRLAAARQRLAARGCPVPAVEARTRFAWIRQATTDCIQRPAERPVTWTDRLDRVLTHKIWGTLIFLALMFLVFQSIFTWAKPLMKLIGAGKDFLGDLLREGMAPGPLTSLLVDGILEGVGSVVVFLPQIVILFGFVALLEDCGYMARAAFLMDKLMSRCGLSGKSFIPMLSSVACAVPGIMATRVIENRRDRLATILVAPLMSCSARLPVYTLLIGAFLMDGYDWWVPGVVMFSMYGIGLVIAPLVALILKRTLLRGETPIFVMEMPVYKLPSFRTVVRRVTDSAWAFLRRAGTFILASMIVVWALLYFPYTNAKDQSYEQLIAQEEEKIKDAKEENEPLEKKVKDKTASAQEKERQAELKEVIDPVQDRINDLQAEWKSRSYLGRMGHAIEPVVKPLGWDWRIGMAALASFPAREVVVGTLGIIYSKGKVDTEDKDETRELGNTLKAATWDDAPEQKVFSVPTALSLMVFFALCCQCVSTLAIIRRETNSWRWPIFAFTYMTVLAYVASLAAYQIGSMIG